MFMLQKTRHTHHHYGTGLDKLGLTLLPQDTYRLVMIDPDAANSPYLITSIE